MKTLLLAFSVVLLFSCSDSTELDRSNIWGTWHDIESYNGVTNVNGQIDSVSYPNILYHLYEDGRYEVENELPWGVPSNGVLEYDEQNELVIFTPELVNEELGISRTYKFEVLSLSDSELEVMFKYWGAPLEEGQDPIEFEIYRKFEKE